MVAKAGLGVIGLGAISVGGIALANPAWIGMGDHMSHWTPLSKDHDFSNSIAENGAYKGKFGETYKNYLTGVVGTNKEQDKNTTKSWWEWSFKRLKEDSLKTSGSSFTPSGKFKYSKQNNESKVNKPVSGTEVEKGLNQICKQAYKANTNNVASNATDSDTTKFKEADVWRYCSPIGQKPKTINENSGEQSYGNDKIGEKAKSELISVRDKGNDWFWKIRDWELTGSKDFTKITVSSSGTEDYFSKQLGKKHIKDLCGEAYRSSSSATSTDAQNPKPTEDATKKYCSLSITQQTQ